MGPMKIPWEWEQLLQFYWNGNGNDFLWGNGENANFSFSVFHILHLSIFPQLISLGILRWQCSPARIDLKESCLVWATFKYNNFVQFTGHWFVCDRTGSERDMEITDGNGDGNWRKWNCKRYSHSSLARSGPYHVYVDALLLLQFAASSAAHITCSLVTYTCHVPVRLNSHAFSSRTTENLLARFLICFHT